VEPASALSTPARRYLTLSLFLFALALSAVEQAAAATPDASSSISIRGTAALNQPVAVYNNWSAYDELSDNIELTEQLAMKELCEILRLRRAGVRIDYYVMDAFWYSPGGGYRQFRSPHWPNGPERWLEACRTNGIKPGLWVASNVPFRIDVLPEWRSSVDATGSAMCMFDGGFLPQFMQTLQYWYDRDVRMFKFDFANLTIATASAARQLSKEEVINRNSDALRQALMRFREHNPDVIFAAFNGFGGDTENEGTFAPVHTGLDLRWLQAFDSLYCGDPRLSDVPAMNFWRSMDLYTDHMVRYFAAAGVPLERIDNTGCMVGVAGTCYGRRTEAWKSMLLLEHARGGWMNVYYGNLELLDDAKARWFAKVQALYFKLQTFGRTYPFGPLPGKGQPYGFCSLTENGALYTVANPSQAVSIVKLPRVNRLQQPLTQGRIQFCDAGFSPRLSGDQLTLGPEQLAAIGYGEYARTKYDLGVQEDVVVPQDIRRLEGEFVPTGTNAVAATLTVPKSGDVRIVVQQFAEGKPLRISRGAPPHGISLAKILQIKVLQDGRSVPVAINYDKALWSGLSWAVGEVRGSDLKVGLPLTVQCVSLQERPVNLKVELYLVNCR
jgi:hypothetical protein